MQVNIEFKLVEEEREAWKALGGYKFMMFGYHAAMWVNWNKCLPKPYPNPFRGLVLVARGEDKGQALVNQLPHLFRD